MKQQTFIKYKSLLFVFIALSSICAVIGSGFLHHNTDHQTVGNAENSFTVIIDPGHGGEDGGAVGESGTIEKDINLAISYKLYELFSLTDINAVMTRYDDRLLYNEGQNKRKKYYDVRNREAIALEYDNPLFISIHQNKFPISKYKGLQVYYSSNHPDSKIVAETIQSEVAAHIQKDNKRKIKESGGSIYLMHALECPAVLVECGFLSNNEDETNLNSVEYQKELAYVIFSSIMQYFSQNEV